MLCSLLENTGVAGKPDSFFRRESIRDWAIELDVDPANSLDERTFNQLYLQAVQQEGAGKTAIFGLRLMWENLDGLLQILEALYPGFQSDCDRLEAAFGQTKFIYLSREDKVAQAVSLLKASQTGLWHIASDGTELERTMAPRDPHYDPVALATLVDELETHGESWEQWFARQNIVPFRITYESLSRNFSAVLEKLFSFLGLDSSLTEHVVPSTAKLADVESVAWANRFREDSANRTGSGSHEAFLR